ncbi:TPA: transcriptional regulator [Enterococcus faecium]|nr:transcriptional regulator [Enterococcus faecium]HBK5674705.1 transcriptional regulator [Enterococcus faecium]HBL3124719.1 transcriptional regulator [Enterococcus faecium]
MVVGMGGIFGKKAEDVQGSIINGVTIIGDTGKRDSSGNQIVIARNKNNEVFESSLSNIKRGVVNGTGEESGYVNLKKANEKYHVEGTYVKALSVGGTKGVNWDKRRNKWKARLYFKREYVLQKDFNTKEEAIQARLAAEEKYFKPILEKYENKKEND